VESRLERVAIPVRELRNLLTYYGKKRCVVSGSTNDVDWHHLDDDPSRSTFENLVPVARDFNLRLAQYARDTSSTRGIALDPLLSPVGLAITAERQLLLGHPHLALGASRIGVFIQQSYLASSLDAIVSASARALHYARHAFDERLIMDILVRNVLQPAERDGGRVGTDTRVGLFMELGALLQDTGETMLSSEVLDHALTSATEGETEIRPAWVFELLWRRSRDFATMNDPARAKELLQRSSDWMDGSVRQSAHVGRVSAANATRLGKWVDALDMLERLRADLITRAGELRAFSSTYWATASVLIDFATAMLHTHGKRHLDTVMTSLADATRLLQDSRGGISSRRLREIRNAAQRVPASVTTAIKRLPRVERRASESLKAVITMVVAKLAR
jgi:hypothetical protein